MNFGFTRDVQNTNFGYSLHVNIGEDSFGISPQIIYSISNDISLSNTLSISHNGNLRNSFGVSYELGSNKTCSIFFNTNLKDWDDLQETCLVLVYNHFGYLFKVPVYLCNQP